MIDCLLPGLKEKLRKLETVCHVCRVDRDVFHCMIGQQGIQWKI